MADLSGGAAALGLALSSDQLAKLAQYLALLQKWNKTYNLTAVRGLAQMLTHHLLDSLAVVPPLLRTLSGGPGLDAGAAMPTPRVLDVGSGAGLPGAVLAICCPQIRVDCVDTVAKKAAFINQAAAELKLPNLRGVHARVEALPPPDGGYAVVCSRAFASLADFVGLTRHLLAPQGVWLAMKGKRPDAEVAELAQKPPAVTVFHVEQLAVPGLGAERCIVWMQPGG